jgi:beta-ketoacyl-acyl-carrier-protein synthase II
MPRRAVITGMGIIAPNGIGKEVFWDAITRGRGAGGPITRFDASAFPSRIAAEVHDFDARTAGLDDEQIKRSDRSTHFALGCAYEAIEDSGLDLRREDPGRIGVCIGTAGGGVTSYESIYMRNHPAPDRAVVPVDLAIEDYSRTMINRSSIEVAHALGAHNMCSSMTATCQSGSEAVGLSWRAIRHGEAEIMCTGGADACISPILVGAYGAMGALTRRNDEPRRASRPFDADRDGFLIAEGAGVMVLEELEHARSRGAHIYAEIVGFAATSNAYHMAAMPKEPEPLARALRKSMQQSGLRPEHIGYVNAHGTGTGQNDVFETLAFKEAFGAHAYRIPISSTKSMTGHGQGAISAVEIMVCALAIERDLLPPTINYEHPDPECDLDYIPNVAREAHINAALCDANGFGGIHSSVALNRFQWQPS